MPEQLHFPWISAGLLVLLANTILVLKCSDTERARRQTVIAILACAALFGVSVFELGQKSEARLLEPFPIPGMAGLGHLFCVDALNAIPLLLFSLLSAGVALMAPKRKVTPQWLAGLLILTSCTLAVYAANNFLVIVLAWGGSIAPFLSPFFFEIKSEKETPQWSKLILILSFVFLLIGGAFILFSAPDSNAIELLSLSTPRTGNGTLQRLAFASLMIAVFLRKGLVPVHSWVLAAFDRGPMLPLTLLVNGHLGAFLTIRVAIPFLPDVAREALPLLGDLGLLTAAYTALLALAERKPRRLLALLSISQASFILVGLESSNTVGVAGGLLHWQVVTVATTILAAVYTGLEARLGAPIEGDRFLGLATSAPRLAVFFAVSGLALVGLPLTLGFPAEDLLLHGTLTTHPKLGIVLPIVTALNAIHVIRLFCLLFLGRSGNEAKGLADALPRERWVLTAALLFLVIGGIAPGGLVRFPAAAAEKLAGHLTGASKSISLR